ncbi:MAG: sugar phosphate isomerase/epimerase [Ruminococcaceae bacterium]|nr:sugar phosphate isomerase/epimerase [Oscillospiraceae bacterium]
MNLATTTYDFFGCVPTQFEMIECLKKSGFSYADYSFEIDYKNRDGVYSADWKDYVKKLNEHCDKTGVKIAQSHSPMGKPLEPNNDDFINDTIRCIEACGELGIPNIVVHSGYLPGYSKKETLAKNKIFYEKLLCVAEKYGVEILVENFNKMCVEGLYWIDNATDLLEMIECVNHPLFQAVWDTGHANMQPMTQEDEITLLGSHIKALHIQDNDGNLDQHLCPFFGTLDMDSVLKGLKNIGYDGFFTFEATAFFNQKAHPNTNFTKDLEYRFAAEKLMHKIGESIVASYLK